MFARIDCFVMYIYLKKQTKCRLALPMAFCLKQHSFLRKRFWVCNSKVRITIFAGVMERRSRAKQRIADTVARVRTRVKVVEYKTMLRRLFPRKVVDQCPVGTRVLTLQNSVTLQTLQKSVTLRTLLKSVTLHSIPRPGTLHNLRWTCKFWHQ